MIVILFVGLILMIVMKIINEAVGFAILVTILILRTGFMTFED